MTDLRAELQSTAHDLATSHKDVDHETTTVLYYPPQPGEAPVVRLLEVTGSCPTLGEVWPVAFGAAPEEGVPFPSVVILMSGEDFRALKNQQLRLPEGWTGEPVVLFDEAA